MISKALFLCTLALAATAAPQRNHNLPVLFQFSQPGHNVAVFRGADLRKAIASGLVKGFGNLGDNKGSDYDAKSATEAKAAAEAAADAKASAERKAAADAKA